MRIRPSYILAAGVAAVAVGGYLWWTAPAPRSVATVVSADAFACVAPTGVEVDRPPVAPPVSERPVPGTVPDDFVPVKAVVCDAFTHEQVAADKTSVFSEHHHAGDFTDAIEQLNAPSARRSLFPSMCGDYSLAVVPDMWLLDADGRAVFPSFPLHDCGYENTLGQYTIQSMPEVETIDRRTQLTDYDITAYYGCSPVLALPNPGIAAVESDALSFGGLCHFDVSGPAPVFDGIRGASSDLPTLLEELVRTSPPAADCAESANAVVATSVTGLDQINWEPVPVMIELDGCRRILIDGYLPLGPISENQARLLGE